MDALFFTMLAVAGWVGVLLIVLFLKGDDDA